MPIEIRSLRQDELPQWFEHVSAVFTKTPRSYFERHWYADPWRDLQGIRVAVDGDRIAGTVRVFRRRVHLGGQVVSMGGIGEVSTRPEYRGQGISFRLLEDALRIMESWGLAVSMLFASRHGHYGRHGWTLVRNPLRSVLVDPSSVVDPSTAVDRSAPASAPAPAAPVGEIQCRPLDLGNQGDLAQVMDLYTRYVGATLDGPVVRDDPEYWRDWVSVEWGRGFGAFAGRRLVSYVALIERSDHLYVQEFAVDPAWPTTVMPAQGAVDAAPSDHAGYHPLHNLLEALLCRAVASFGTSPRRVVFPPIIDPENQLSADGESVLEDWMVKVVRADLLPPVARAAVEAMLSKTEAAPPRFWFWPTDWY